MSKSGAKATQAKGGNKKAAASTTAAKPKEAKPSSATPAASATSSVQPNVATSVPASTIQPNTSAQPAVKTGAKGKKQNKPQVGGPQAQAKQTAQPGQKAAAGGKPSTGAAQQAAAVPAVAPAAAAAPAQSFLVPTRVVIITRGRYAGRKAVIVKNFADEKSKSRKFPHLLVAGIDKYPQKVTKDMGKRKLAKRSRVRPFLKVINQQHVMPTRYGLDVPLANVLKGATLEDVSVRHHKEADVKRAFQERYNTGKNRWFFSPLRF